ncbi:hypothetical protein AHAS_Ahas06G0238600 [Arachis hypogaea]
MSFQTESLQHPIPSPYYSGSVKAGYWPSGNSLSPSSIDTRYFTHIYYAFVEPEPNTFNLIITSSDQNYIPQFINGLSNRNPPVKTILSIGGGASNATLFSLMASTVKSRAAFINSTIQVARQYGFDGLDLDWEFPENEQDMANLALLFKEWHQAVVLEAKSGVPPSKLVFGLPLYGRAWKLQDPKVHGDGAPAVGAADGTDGTMNYNDILEFNKKNKATVVFDRSAVSYYTYAGTTWMSYDDAPSMTRKDISFGKLEAIRIGLCQDKLQVRGDTDVLYQIQNNRCYGAALFLSNNDYYNIRFISCYMKESFST